MELKMVFLVDAVGGIVGSIVGEFVVGHCEGNRLGAVGLKDTLGI